VRRAGFTIAAPRLAAVGPSLSLERSARFLALDLEKTRWLAIARNSRARLDVDLASGRYAAEVEGDSGYVPVFARDLPSGIGFDETVSTRIVDGRISIVFQPRGNTFSNATIALETSGDRVRRVVINQAGRVRCS
jgi:Tfp pilus assembly protein FimT